MEACADLSKALTSPMVGLGEVLGPAECPLARISGNYRYHVLVRATRFSEAHARVAAVVESFKAPSGVHLEIDVDPQALL
jgi:primosomal protein N' (replication factor Y)